MTEADLQADVSKFADLDADLAHSHFHDWRAKRTRRQTPMRASIRDAAAGIRRRRRITAWRNFAGEIVQSLSHRDKRDVTPRTCCVWIEHELTIQSDIVERPRIGIERLTKSCLRRALMTRFWLSRNLYCQIGGLCCVLCDAALSSHDFGA